MLNSLTLKLLYATTLCPRIGGDLFGYAKRAKEINTSNWLGDVKNNLCNGIRLDPFLLWVLILQAINAL